MCCTQANVQSRPAPAFLLCIRNATQVLYSRWWRRERTIRAATVLMKTSCSCGSETKTESWRNGSGHKIRNGKLCARSPWLLSACTAYLWSCHYLTNRSFVNHQPFRPPPCTSFKLRSARSLFHLSGKSNSLSEVSLRQAVGCVPTLNMVR